MKRRFDRLESLQAWDSFDLGAVVGSNPRIFATAKCVNLGPAHDVRIGDGFVCRGTLRREASGGELVIGDNVYIGDYSLVSCANRVHIDDNVLVAFGVRIFDNDTHPLDPTERRSHVAEVMSAGHLDTWEIVSAPIVIEQDVWIGFEATILKGVTVGRGSVVGARSVVTSDVPSGVVVAGNPARIIREIG